MIELSPLATVLLLALGAITYVASGIPAAPERDHPESNSTRALRAPRG